MKALLRELADRYSDRIVLIDAPACLVTSDPAALARVVGQTLLVVEADVTTQQRVEAALELLRPGANTYLVLNKTRFR
jgi:receptor protein-tyrosine kinase